VRTRTRTGQLIILALSALALLLPAPAGADDDPTTTWIPRGDDYGATVVEPSATNVAALSVTPDSDPHGLVPQAAFVQRYSLGTDHFEVWLCGDTGLTHAQVITELEAETVPYYDALSAGRYHLDFTAVGSIADSTGDCVDAVKAASGGTFEAALIISDNNNDPRAGYATPGLIGYTAAQSASIAATFPENERYAVVHSDWIMGHPTVVTHELGHTLHWPHSNSGLNEYDNPIDVMSGNLTASGYTNTEPYATLAFNRHQSGWIDTGDVAVNTGTYAEITLQPYDTAGTQMLVIPTSAPGLFYTLGTRVASSGDPFPASWTGVEVYLIDHDCGIDGFGGVCPGIFRSQTMQPPNPYTVDHVLQVGESITLNGVTVEVTGRAGDGFTLAVGESGTGLPFIDIASSQFVGDIVWLADNGITKGCNPPANDRFCPTQAVTRGQMAAFLVRFLGLTAVDDGVGFVDDDGSVFETDIEKLATAGITKGCNPPTNDRYCPDDNVTRGQMAAFLVRALGLTEIDDDVAFVDDDDSVFETDIEKLATAGITKGCNPPTNDRYCPNANVTRGQMAAFLHRASVFLGD